MSGIRTVNYLAGLSSLNRFTRLKLTTLLKDAETGKTKPEDAVPDSDVQDFKEAIEAATNVVFSERPTNELLAELLKDAINEIIEKK